MIYYRTPSRLATLWAAGTLLAFSQTALSSGFMLHEQNASGLGEFYAGAGAIAEDASTNYYNPAGLTLLPGTQIVVSGVWVNTNFNFDGTVTTGPYEASGKAEGGTGRTIPAIHISHQFNDKIAAGISFTVPFGLATHYPEDSIVRYQAILSDLKTYNIGPSLAYRVVPWLSLGVGFDAEYATVDITTATNYHVGYIPNTETDAFSENTANSWAWGWHAGALAIIDEKSRVGLNFRSHFDHDFEGDSIYTDPTYGQASSDVSGNINFPWMIDLAGVHVFDDKWTVLGTVSYIHWSTVSQLELENVSVVLPIAEPPVHVTGTSVDELNFKNSWGAFAGLRYQINPTVMVKVGGGFDQSPTVDADRDLRLPDSNRWIASTGIRVMPQQIKWLSADLAYAHIWAVNAPIDKDLSSETNPVNTAIGNVTTHADLVGVQLTVKI
jgi:long-chain fatty acid transport protein